MSENTRRPLTTKVHLYQALYLFNRGFEITLAGLKRLEELGIFRQENLSDYEVRLETTRALANEELTGVMQDYEQEDSGYWDNRSREREKEMSDPDDVFFDARDRREEIKSRSKTCSRGWPGSTRSAQPRSASGGSAHVRSRNQLPNPKSHHGGTTARRKAKQGKKQKLTADTRG